MQIISGGEQTTPPEKMKNESTENTRGIAAEGEDTFALALMFAMLGIAFAANVIGAAALAVTMLD